MGSRFSPSHEPGHHVPSLGVSVGSHHSVSRPRSKGIFPSAGRRGRGQCEQLMTTRRRFDAALAVDTAVMAGRQVALNPRSC
jgi:hypothetical protein